jgi:hypothetical protein
MFVCLKREINIHPVDYGCEVTRLDEKLLVVNAPSNACTRSSEATLVRFCYVQYKVQLYFFLRIGHCDDRK